MVKKSLDENDVLGASGIADRTFADHSGDIQHGYELGSLTRGLHVYYPLERGEGTIIRDGAHDVIGRMSGPAWTTGHVGNYALSFDGGTDIVSTKSFNSPPPGGLTVAGWGYLNTIDTGNNQIEFISQSGADGGFRTLHSDNTGMQLQVSDGSNSYVTQGASVSANTWFHYAGVFTPDGTMRQYINGSLVTTDTGAVYVPMSTDILIGDTPDFPNGWDGMMDDLRVYSRPLSQPEIQALYNTAETSGRLVEERDLVTYPDPAAISRYEFENDVTDSWGNNNGTDNTSVGFVNGVYGQAKDFDGTDDYVSIGESVYDPNENFTISAWINPENDSNREVIFGTAGTTDDYYMFVNRSDSDGLCFQYNNNGTGTITTTSSGEFVSSTDGWSHAVITRSGSTWRIYINGRPVKQGSDGIHSLSLKDNYIGADDSNVDNRFTGPIDDLRVYNKALSRLEVITLFNKGVYRISRGDVV